MNGKYPEAGASMSSDSTTDDIALLLRRAGDGDQLAWNELVARFSGLLWSICRAHRLNAADAADAFQQTWLRLLEHLDSIQQASRLAAWLATTCRRECLSVLRHGKRSRPTDDDRLLDRLAGQTPGADRSSLIADRDAVLWRTFARLDERCQRILRVLVVQADLGRPSYELAAVALGMPIGSLGPRRARCLLTLRKLLDAEGISPLAPDS